MRIDQIVKSLVAVLAHRKPQGRDDKCGRWYPTPLEDADGVSARVRSPSHRWPLSYLRACKTAKHRAALVRIGLAGGDVPSDVMSAIRVYLDTAGLLVPWAAWVDAVPGVLAADTTEWLKVHSENLEREALARKARASHDAAAAKIREDEAKRSALIVEREYGIPAQIGGGK